MAVDSLHRYSNKAEWVNQDTYDDFKLRKPLVSMLYIKKYFSVLRVKETDDIRTPMNILNIKNKYNIRWQWLSTKYNTRVWEYPESTARVIETGMFIFIIIHQVALILTWSKWGV